MSAYDWLIAAILVIATAITRSTLVVLGNRIQIAPRVEAALRFAPACALSAILAPPLLANAQGQLVGWQGSPVLWAAVATTVVMWFSRSILLAISCGMAAFWLLRGLGLVG